MPIILACSLVTTGEDITRPMCTGLLQIITLLMILWYNEIQHSEGLF